MSVPIRINKLHWPVTVLGYGKRAGIWLQGCTIACPGCCSKDTWELLPESQTSIDNVLGWLSSISPAELDGITISGGEPFQQPDALRHLLTAIWDKFGRDNTRDILVYSGYSHSVLTRKFRHILDLCDVVISEPYKQHLPSQPLRGSGNQIVHINTALGLARYSELQLELQANKLQIDFDGTALTVIGIPRNGDLDKLSQRMAESGLTFDSSSWKG